MGPKKKRCAPPQPPGILRKYLTETFSDTPCQSDLLNGHVLLIYINAQRSPTKTEKELSSRYPDLHLTAKASLFSKIVCLVRNSLNKYQDLRVKTTLQHFKDVCNQKFITTPETSIPTQDNETHLVMRSDGGSDPSFSVDGDIADIAREISVKCDDSKNGEEFYVRKCEENANGQNGSPEGSDIHPKIQHIVSVRGCSVTFNIEITGVRYTFGSGITTCIEISKKKALNWLGLFGYKEENIIEIDDETEKLSGDTKSSDCTDSTNEEMIIHDNAIGATVTIRQEADRLDDTCNSQDLCDVINEGIKPEKMFDDDSNCGDESKQKLKWSGIPALTDEIEYDDFLRNIHEKESNIKRKENDADSDTDQSDGAEHADAHHTQPITETCEDDVNTSFSTSMEEIEDAEQKDSNDTEDSDTTLEPPVILSRIRKRSIILSPCEDEIGQITKKRSKLIVSPYFIDENDQQNIATPSGKKFSSKARWLEDDIETLKTHFKLHMSRGIYPNHVEITDAQKMFSFLENRTAAQIKSKWQHIMKKQ